MLCSRSSSNFLGQLFHRRMYFSIRKFSYCNRFCLGVYVCEMMAYILSPRLHLQSSYKLLTRLNSWYFSTTIILGLMIVFFILCSSLSWICLCSFCRMRSGISHVRDDSSLCCLKWCLSTGRQKLHWSFCRSICFADNSLFSILALACL